jgi:cytochrome c biogenesis factor
LEHLNNRVLWTGILLVLMLVLTGGSSVLVVISYSGAAEEDVWTATSKEHAEDVIRVELVLSKVLLVPLLETLLTPMLIVNLSLLRII